MTQADGERLAVLVRRAFHSLEEIVAIAGCHGGDASGHSRVRADAYVNRLSLLPLPNGATSTPPGYRHRQTHHPCRFAMAIGRPVSEVPDSEEEPLTSSPDPRSIAGLAEEGPQHALPGTDGALDEDCEIQNTNSDSLETSAHASPHFYGFEQCPDTPTPAHHRTTVPADCDPPFKLSIDHASAPASDLVSPPANDVQNQSSITEEQDVFDDSRDTRPSGRPDDAHSSLTSTNCPSRTDTVKDINEAAQGPRESHSSTQPVSSTSTNIQKQKTPTRITQENTLAELKAQKAALIASLASLPSIRALIAQAKDANTAVQEGDAEYTENEIMGAAQRLNQKHIKLLHEYNEIKDVGQGLMGLIADQRGVRIIEVQDEFGIDPKD